MTTTETISFHDLAYLPLKRGLESTISFTKKAQQHATTSSTPEADLVSGRLAPDMYPFWEQCYLQRRFISQILQRLTAESSTPDIVDPQRPKEGDITTLQQCLDLLQTGLDELNAGNKAGAFSDENAGKQTTVVYGPMSLPTNNRGFLEGMMLPNMYFHVSIAYAILRMKGVQLGKVDYMMPFFADYLDKDAMAQLTETRVKSAKAKEGSS